MSVSSDAGDGTCGNPVQTGGVQSDLGALRFTAREDPWSPLRGTSSTSRAWGSGRSRRNHSSGAALLSTSRNEWGLAIGHAQPWRKTQAARITEGGAGCVSVERTQTDSWPPAPSMNAMPRTCANSCTRPSLRNTAPASVLAGRPAQFDRHSHEGLGRGYASAD